MRRLATSGRPNDRACCAMCEPPSLLYLRDQGGSGFRRRRLWGLRGALRRRFVVDGAAACFCVKGPFVSVFRDPSTGACAEPTPTGSGDGRAPDRRRFPPCLGKAAPLERVGGISELGAARRDGVVPDAGEERGLPVI